CFCGVLKKSDIATFAVPCRNVFGRRKASESLEVANQMCLVGKAEIGSDPRPIRRVSQARPLQYCSKSCNACESFRRNSEMPCKLALQLASTEPAALLEFVHSQAAVHLLDSEVTTFNGRINPDSPVGEAAKNLFGNADAFVACDFGQFLPELSGKLPQEIGEIAHQVRDLGRLQTEVLQESAWPESNSK